MATFLIRRLFQMGIVLLISSIFIYLILNLVPGGPLDQLMQATDPRNRPTQADIARIERSLGLDKPWYLQYVTWLAGDTWLGRIGFEQYEGTRRGIIRGDWGESWRIERNRPVWDVIWRRLPDTLRLMVTATLVSIVLAIPIGIYSAVKQYSKLDN